MNKKDSARLKEIKRFIAFLVLSPDHLMRKEDELDTIINHFRWLIRLLGKYRRVAMEADIVQKNWQTIPKEFLEGLRQALSALEVPEKGEGVGG